MEWLNSKLDLALEGIARSRGVNGALRLAEIAAGASNAFFCVVAAALGLGKIQDYEALVQAHWWAPLPLGVLGFTASETRRKAQKHSVKLWESDRATDLRQIVKSAIFRLRHACFAQSDLKEPETHHRLSVFRLSENEDSLGLYCRSCQSTSGSDRTWAFSFEDDSKCEGIVSQTAHHNVGIGIPGKSEDPLPNVLTENNPTTEDVEEYARRTFVATDTVRSHRCRARSYASMPINLASGRRWGVLILDSTGTKAPEGRNSLWATTKATARMLGDVISQFEEIPPAGGRE